MERTDAEALYDLLQDADTPRGNLGHVTVWRDAMVQGHASGDPEPGVFAWPTVDARAAMLTVYPSSDAHFVPYGLVDADGEVVNACPRLNKGQGANAPAFAAGEELAAEGLRIAFFTLQLDIDCPEAHRPSESTATRPVDWEQVAAWQDEQLDLLLALPVGLLQGLGYYQSKRGYRLVWALAEPVTDPDEYRWALASLRAELARHGINADPLVDLQRCYRLPRTLRGGVLQDRPALFDAFGLEPLGWAWPPMPEEGPDGAPRNTTGSGGKYAGIENVREPLPDTLPDEITSNRNVELTRYAGRWWSQGYTGQEVADDLLRLNARRCKPPLPDDEVLGIARSVQRYARGEEPPAWKATATPNPKMVSIKAALANVPPGLKLGSDTEIAAYVWAVIKEACGVDPVFILGSVYGYNGDLGIWTPRTDDITAVVESLDGTRIGGKKSKVSIKINAAHYRNALDVLSKRAIDSTKWLEGGAVGVASAGGYMLENGDVVPHSPDHRATFRLDVVPAPGEPRLWLQTLREIFAHDPPSEARLKIQVIREFVAACMIGTVTRYERALVFVGDGANGKSVIQSVISALFPAAYRTALSPQDLQSDYKRARLAKSRLNLVNEMPTSDIYDTAAIKAIVSGQEISARPIREAPFEYCPTAGNLLSANDLPHVRDRSHGMWRRWIMVQFIRRFAPEEQDKTRAERIIDEELPQVAQWFLEGARTLAKRGDYELPESHKQELARWRDEQDSITNWLQTQVQPVPLADGLNSDAAFAAYREWAVESGFTKLPNITQWTSQLRRAGWEVLPPRTGIAHVRRASALPTE